MQLSMTVPYKQVNDLSAHRHLSPRCRAPPSEPVPAVVYFDGGRLTVGDRMSWFPAWLASEKILIPPTYLARAPSAPLVSADYSLLQGQPTPS
ncbi:hypothetical protein FA95DRAFT_303662 [Auriscalpium vulgare]|uniref:Uncharacterized protein n=1 Tax=Auriscalpium vulgare TaxID=40419 RepID=A0ACB8RIS1_9AGAM|nr:hypothetical protein FA95DRAFT_303662 [Auriscalpium vulgare]